MKRVLLTVAVALLIPGLLMAAPTIGVYFDNLKGSISPELPLTPFNGYLILHQSGYIVTAVEYQLVLDPNIILTGETYPAEYSANLGSPLVGESITYWPPLDGVPDGYDVLATFELQTVNDCAAMPDALIQVVANSDSGELRCTVRPDNDFIYPVGLTTVVCPNSIATDSKSWGSIKSMY